MTEREPAVLIVGSDTRGAAVAARLREAAQQTGMTVLVVDSLPCPKALVRSLAAMEQIDPQCLALEDTGPAHDWYRAFEKRAPLNATRKGRGRARR